MSLIARFDLSLKQMRPRYERQNIVTYIRLARLANCLGFGKDNGKITGFFYHTGRGSPKN